MEKKSGPFRWVSRIRRRLICVLGWHSIERDIHPCLEARHHVTRMQAPLDTARTRPLWHRAPWSRMRRQLLCRHFLTLYRKAHGTTFSACSKEAIRNHNIKFASGPASCNRLEHTSSQVRCGMARHALNASVWISCADTPRDPSE